MFILVVLLFFLLALFRGGRPNIVSTRGVNCASTRNEKMMQLSSPKRRLSPSQEEEEEEEEDEDEEEEQQKRFRRKSARFSSSLTRLVVFFSVSFATTPR